jgi:hypothetical protein
MSFYVIQLPNSLSHPGPLPILNILLTIDGWFRFMAFNATFNNISVISWRSVLLVEKTRVPGENH